MNIVDYLYYLSADTVYDELVNLVENLCEVVETKTRVNREGISKQAARV